MYDIIEVTIDGKKVDPKDVVVKWRERGEIEHSGGIELYAYAVALGK